MTPRPHATSPYSAHSFDDLMADVMAAAARFGHREHVHLTWLAVRRFGVPAAVSLVSDGIQRTARYADAPQKYHATVSRAWVELVGYHAAEHADDNFAAFAEHNPALLDKRLLTRFYHPATLASPGARTGWAEPDRAPLPWCHADRRQPAKEERPGSAVIQPVLDPGDRRGEGQDR